MTIQQIGPKPPDYRKAGKWTRPASECNLAEELHTASPRRFEGCSGFSAQRKSKLGSETCSSWPSERACCCPMIPMCWRNALVQKNTAATSIKFMTPAQ